MSARHVDLVRTALRSYADRGVFRNFEEAGTKGSKTVFVFRWLERRPLIFIYDDAAKTVQFKNCFPNADDDLAAHVRAYLAGRADAKLPEHRRIDPRKAEARLVRRAGQGSLVLRAKRGHVDYAVERLLKLLNEVFVQLHANFFEYMIREFDVSQD